MTALAQLSACVVIYIAFRALGSSFGYGWFGGVIAANAIELIRRVLQ